MNNCDFKFSMVSEWHVIIEEDKNNLLQFAKVFPTKFLKLPIRQSFTLPPFCTIIYTSQQEYQDHFIIYYYHQGL